MTAATLFPKLLNCQTAKSDTSAWNVELDLDKKTDVNRLLALIDEAAQHSANGSGDDLLEFASCLAADVAVLSKSGQHPNQTLMFLRLLAASLAIDCAAHRKQFSIVRDWILFAIRGEFSKEQVVELDDISDPQKTVVESSNATADFVRTPFLIWAWGLFYYVRMTGDLTVVAASYLAFVERVCVAKLDELAVETLVYAGTWATAEGDPRGESILRRLAAVLQKVPLPKTVAIQLSVALSAGVGQRAGLDTVQIAETALSKFNADLNAFDRLQLLAHCCKANVDKIVVYLAEIENAILTHWAFVESQTRNKIYGRFERERSFDVVAPLICTLATNDRIHEAIRLVCMWRRGNQVADLPRTAILLPTWHKGTTFATTGRVAVVNAEGMTDSLLALTQAGNAFFGTNVVLKDDNRFIAHEASRPGVPDTHAGASDEYERAITAHYRFDVIAPASAKSGADAMLLVPHTRDPLQPVMLKSVDWTLPIAVSCAPPQPDRIIRHVCIWWASTDFGEFEQRWVTHVFQSRGIEVTTPTTKSKDEFTRLYKSDDVDVFWMIGHGRFDHYYPDNMSIDLSATDNLTFEDWIAIERAGTKDRRLFVANLCDSGTTAVLGGTGELGLPVVLVHPSQALVAHLWPVSSMHAAIFGALLAIELAKSIAFFEAYCRTSRLMIKGRDAIEAHLQSEFGSGHEIIQRLRGAADIWAQLFIWGSPVFLS